MNKLSTWLVATLFLTGCYSFNQIHLPEKGSNYKVDPKLVEGIVVEALVEKTANVVPPPTEMKRDTRDIVCQPYLMPQITKTPELPIKELMKVGPNDPDALDKIQSQHIAELRAFIVKMKSDIRNSHNDYLSKCYSAAGIKLPSNDSE